MKFASFLSVFLPVILSSGTALACMPSGKPLTKKEKADLNTALSNAQPACLGVINSQIGDLNSDAVRVYVEARDENQEATYKVIGKMSMEIEWTSKGRKAGGTYQCKPVTGLKRGC